MKLTNKDAVLQCLQRIELFQRHQEAVRGAIQCIYTERGNAQQSTVDAGSLLDILHRMELDEWRNLAMWGLTLDDAERDRIKAAVHERFLRDGMDVRRWLTPDGRSAQAWCNANEAEFREMARAAFSPRT